MPPILEDSIPPIENHKTQVRTTDCGTAMQFLSATRRTPLILPTKPSLIDHATLSGRVAAFCIAVLFKLIPKEFWGSGPDQEHNMMIVKENISKFVHQRRFESLTVHEVSQGLKVCLPHVVSMISHS